MNLTETVLKARDGDPAAVSALYEAYKRPICYFCLRVTNDMSASLDLLQECYQHAFQGIHRLVKPEKFGAWILYTAAQRARYYLFGQQKITAPGLSTRGFKLHCGGSAPELAVENENIRTTVTDIVDTFPGEERLAVMLYFFCRMPLPEAARNMDVTEETLKVLLMSASSRMTLRLAMTEEDESGIGLGGFNSLEQIGPIFDRCAQLLEIPEDVSRYILASGNALVSLRGEGTAPPSDAFVPPSPYTGVMPRVSEPAPEPAPQESQDSPVLPESKEESMLPEDRPNFSSPEHDPDSKSEQIRRKAAAIITSVGILMIVVSLICLAAHFIRGAKTPAITPPDIEAPSDSVSSDPESNPTESVTDSAAQPTESDPPASSDSTASEEPNPPEPTFVCNPSDYTYKAVEGGLSITGYTGTDTQIELPSERNGQPVIAIAPAAFQGNVTLSGVVIPKSITKLGNHAFFGCTSLTTLTVSDSVTTIGPNAFDRTAWMTNQKDQSFVLAGNVLLAYQKWAKTVTVPDGVTALSNAFYFRMVIETVVLPEGVTHLGQFSFAVCNDLKSIHIPASVISMDPQAIYECPALRAIYVKQGSYAERWCVEHGFASMVVYE